MSVKAFMPETAFHRIVELVCRSSPLQRKKLTKLLQPQDPDFRQSAEEFASQYCHYLEQENIPVQKAVDAYLALCSQMLKCQVAFMKTGRYPSQDALDVFRDIYSNSEHMKTYMIGLALSQFLWPSHYEIYKAFEAHIREVGPRITSYLEIGPGHGLFLLKALDFLGDATEIHAVDISAASIDLTRSIIARLRPKRAGVIHYHVADVLHFNALASFDFILMGEVLEHVTTPDLLLKTLHRLLTTRGTAFISTCANAPAVDHVYLFNNVGEIREMLRSGGFVIQSDHVLPAEDLPMDEILAKKIAVNYCAVVRRASK